MSVGTLIYMLTVWAVITATAAWSIYRITAR